MNDNALALKRFSHEGKDLIAGAQSIADAKRHISVDPLHILAYALKNDAVAEMFKSIGANPDAILDKANEVLNKQKTKTDGHSSLSPETISFIAKLEKTNKGDITVEHIVDGLVNLQKGLVSNVWKSCTITPEMMSTKKPKNPTFTHDLLASAKAGKFDPVVGRDKEVRRLFQILGRRTKNHALIVGETGVGKTAICNALATRIFNGDAPENLHTVSVLELELSSIMSGSRAKGEVDERLKNTLKQLPNNTLLVIANLEMLFASTGISGTSDMLKNVMNKSAVRLLASTTPDGLKKIADKDPGLITGFSQVFIDPTTPELAQEIIRSVASRYEQHHQVAIGENAIAGSVRLAKRYLQDRALPGSAIDLLDEAASRKRMEMGSIPSHIDDVIRRLASLRLQRASYCDDKGQLRSAFESDTSTAKSLKKLNEEIERLEPELHRMQEALSSRESAEISVGELRREYGEVAGKLATAELLKDNNVAGLKSKMEELKGKLVKAEELMTKAPEVEETAVLSEEHCAQVLEDWSGIKASKMLESEMSLLQRMEDDMRKKVVGQDEAVKAVCQAVRRGRMGIRDAGKPIGSFLFLGSSGVGKTLIAKSLAEMMFGTSEAMLRLDMSEYKEQHQAQKLIGAPPGYVDSTSGGLLTEFVRKRPASLLLFDECEKASQAVHDLLLGILDASRLTDGRGTTVDFSNTIIILTSNIGTKRLLTADPSKFDTEDGRKELSDALLKNDLANALRAEFLNRIDSTIVFRPLLPDTLMLVANIELEALNRLLITHELSISVSENAKQALVEDEREISFGARPLKRAITRHLQNRITQGLLDGEYHPGNHINVDYTNNAFTFTKQ